MDTIVNLLNGLALIVPILIGTGLIVKYLPFMQKVSNQLIPLLNAVIAFLVAFGGGASTAQAGMLGDVGRFLSAPGKAAASILVSYGAAWVYEKFLRGPIEAAGLKKT